MEEEVTQNSYYNEDYVSEATSTAIQNALATTTTGASIYVTYYQQMFSNESDRTDQADNVMEYDDVHHSYRKIAKMILKLQGSMEFSFEQEPAVSKWQGTAYVYPYFKAAVGDYFLYDVEEGKQGLFKVNSVKRLTIRTSTWSEIQFELVKYPVGTTGDGSSDGSDDALASLESSVSENYVFDSDTFLSSAGDLTSMGDAATTTELTAYRENLLDYFFSKFYDNDYHHTFVRPDGVFDPYMLEFWYWLTEPCRNMKIPSRLINRPENMNQSIWYHIRYVDAPIKDKIITTYCVDTWRNRIWETTINSLINKPYILIHDSSYKKHTGCTLATYPMTDYVARKEAGDRFGTIMYNYMVDRIANTELIERDILSTPEKDELDMFYQTPFLLYVIDCVIRKMKYGT